MRKEFVIKRIDMPPDGSPYVIVTMTSAKDFQDGAKNQLQFDPSKMNPANMNDMMKDLNKMLSNMGGMLGADTSLKVDMKEYKEMNLSVEDKVNLELTADESRGI